MITPAGFPFIVKVCGITNTAEAQTAIESGANTLGFNFYPKSPRFLTLERAQRIARTVPATVLRLGVFVSPSEAELKHFAAAVPLDVVQLHGRIVPSTALRTWRALAASPTLSLDATFDAEALLLDSPTPLHGGSGLAFDWTLARNLNQKIIVAGGLDASNVAAAVAAAQPYGVDACSGLESSPGRKDPVKVREFVHAALTALRSLDRSRTVPPVLQEFTL